jgi:hypothetical protein
MGGSATGSGGAGGRFAVVPGEVGGGGAGRATGGFFPPQATAMSVNTISTANVLFEPTRRISTPQKSATSARRLTSITRWRRHQQPIRDGGDVYRDL